MSLEVSNLRIEIAHAFMERNFTPLKDISMEQKAEWFKNFGVAVEVAHQALWILCLSGRYVVTEVEKQT